MLNVRADTVVCMSGDQHDDEFRRTVGDIRPLKGKRERVAPPRRPLPVEPMRHETEHPTPAEGPALEIGNTAGVDRRTAERLRRGKLNIDGRLDLHSHTQDDAYRALTAFITDSVARGRRCLLIVTGKGAVSEGGGVLRRRVPQWLNLPPCRGHVLAIAQSQQQHGGAGALYVLLKRSRKNGEK